LIVEPNTATEVSGLGNRGDKIVCAAFQQKIVLAHGFQYAPYSAASLQELDINRGAKLDEAVSSSQPGNTAANNGNSGSNARTSPPVGPAYSRVLRIGYKSHVGPRWPLVGLAARQFANVMPHIGVRVGA
jgi:hypothetical protein